MMPIEMAGEQYKKGGDEIEEKEVLEPKGS